MRGTLKTTFALLVALLLTVSTVPSQTCFAQETPTVAAETTVPAVSVPATTPAVAEMTASAEAVPEPLEVWYGNVKLWEILAGLAVVIWGIIKTRLKVDADWEKKLVSFFEAGVQHTYDEFVRTAKRDSADGKLTKEQVDMARTRAWEASKQYAAEQGIDLGKHILAEQIPVWLTKVWNSFKKDKDSK